MVERGESDRDAAGRRERRSAPRGLAQVPQQGPEEERHGPRGRDGQVPQVQEPERGEREERARHRRRPPLPGQLLGEQVRADAAQDDAGEQREVQREDRRFRPRRRQREHGVREQQVVEGGGAVVGEEDVRVDPRAGTREQRVLEPVELPRREQDLPAPQRGGPHLARERPGGKPGAGRAHERCRGRREESFEEGSAHAIVTRQRPSRSRRPRGTRRL